MSQPPRAPLQPHPHLHLHRLAHARAELDSPWPGTALAGDPQTVTINAYASADGRLLSGLWESSPGLWAIDYQDWEYCHFLEGHCIITPEGGTPVHLRGGDVFVIEPGLKGTWEVVERVRKHYVFSLSPAPQA
jgi:uncharacterized cupin superfamily protein